MVFSSHFIKALILFRCIYYYYAKTKVENVFAIYFNTNIQNCFVLVYFVCHTPQFKMLVFAFQSEIWIAQNFNFTVFEDFCLSLSWKYRFSQNVNHAKVQSKTNKYFKFHVDLTRRRLSVPKKLYRNTLRANHVKSSASETPRENHVDLPVVILVLRKVLNISCVIPEASLHPHVLSAVY